MLVMRKATYDDVLAALDRLASDQVVPGRPFDAEAMAQAHTCLAIELDGRVTAVFGAERRSRDEYEFFGLSNPRGLGGYGAWLVAELRDIAKNLPGIRRAYMWTRDVPRYRVFARAMGFRPLRESDGLILHSRVF